MHENIIEIIYSDYSQHGYITEKQIIDLVQNENIPLFDVEYIMDQLLGKGIIIRENDDIGDDQTEEYDRSNTDYAAIYAEAIEIEPTLIDLIDYIKCIQAPQHREWRILLPQA